MPRGPASPLEIQAEVQKLVEEFNHKNFSTPSPLSRLLPDRNLEIFYIARFKGKFLYFDRADLGSKPSPISRLTGTGVMDDWEFTIYKYSDNIYDSEEWGFPGAELLDGTFGAPKYFS